MKKAIGRCPCAEVLVGSGIRINCLLDTGAQVSTIESFYKEHLAQENDLVDVGQFISISAANGLDIPNVGYVEVDISALGHTYTKLDFLIVKHPQGQMMSTCKQTVPGVIGSNIFRDIAHHLEATRGKQFLQTLKDEEIGEWGSILALYQNMVVSAASVKQTNRVRMSGHDPVLVPARSVKVVISTTKQTDPGRTYTAIVEEHAVGLFPLPNGLMVGAACVTVGEAGTVPIQLANFGTQDVYLKPWTPLGILQTATLGSDIPSTTIRNTEVHVDEMIGGTVESIALDLLSKMSLGDVDEEQYQFSLLIQ